MNKIRIENYSSKFEKSHIEFARVHFNNRRKRINPDYIRWKFKGDRPNQEPSLLLAIEGERVVGQLGLLPGQLELKKQNYNVQWACDLMVHNDYRGKGIANLLYEEAIKRKITLGSDPSPSASKSMQRFGFKSLKGPWKFFYPLKLDVISDMKFKKFSFLLKNVSNPFTIWLNIRVLLCAKPRIKLKEVSLNQVNWAWLDKKKLSDMPRIIHSKDFLTWRLSSLGDYHKAGLIFQEENAYFINCRLSSSSCYLGDFVFTDKAIAKRVLRELILDMRKRGIREIRWMTNNFEETRILSKLGFLRFRSRTNIIYASQVEMFNKSMESETQFYYSYLDSDENI